jgi:hypothetical protein
MLRTRAEFSCRRLWVLPVVAILSVGGLAASGSDQKIDSVWRGRDIRVDGVDDEWHGLTTPVNGQRFAIGFVNDGEWLYFCLVTKDRVTFNQIARQGLIVWLDPMAGRSRTFGLHFPVEPAGLGWDARRPVPDTQDPSTAEGRQPRSIQVEGQDEIEVLGPGKKDVRRVPLVRSGGLVARVGVHGDLLVYELKVPLRRQAEEAGYALNAEPGATLHVTLQTPEWRGPLPPAPGRFRVGVGGGGRMPYPYSPVDTAVLKPLDVRAEVRLAKQ